jgi:hypothetical protein
MITRSRARHIDETTDPEDAGPSKRQVVAPSESGTKHLKMTQDRAVVNGRQLVVDGGQVMAATEEVPRTYADTTTGTDQDEWKKAIARKLESLTSNKTWKLKIEDDGINCDGMLGTQLVAYSDADCAGNRDDRRSVGGMVPTLCGAPVVWRSKFQMIVALSSTEADYMALSDCVQECVWLRRLLKDMGSEQVDPTVIYEDNQGAMALAKNVGYQVRTKHIDIRYHFIREKVASGGIELVYMESKNQLADYLTKGLSTKTLRYLMMASNVGPKVETSN